MFQTNILLPSSGLKSKLSKQISKQEQSLCLLFDSLAYSSALKMEAVCPSERLVNFSQTTWCNIPEGSMLDIFFPKLVLFFYSEPFMRKGV
jgi:hypothetical protein